MVVHVSGYKKEDGTKVKSHTRSEPDVKDSDSPKFSKKDMKNESIAGWKKVSPFRGMETWEKDRKGKAPQYITIEPPSSTTNGTSNYAVWLWEGRYTNRRDVGLPGIRTKKEAVRVAKNYMRNNS